MAESTIGDSILDPKHPNFIPIQDFGLDNIPEGFRSDAVLEYIKNISARTVKLVTRYTSPDRPASSTRGFKDGKRLGSGWVVKVEYLNWQCECPECKESLAPESHCWAVIVNTSTQLVYDSQEAKATQVELFYDKESFREEGKVITLHGADLEVTNPASPYISLLVCFTCDAALASQLDNYRKESMALRSAILREMREDVDLTQFLVICHPQGLPKHIWMSPELERVRSSTLFSSAVSIYSARTCPGVVGGPVVILHGKDCEDLVWFPVVDNNFDTALSNFSISTNVAANDFNYSQFC
ncbi:hypothetical protein ElyMa_004301000 [Elysia marginata]|uniref:Uncharacterized protein n=1 Tax=Elysia marginata TaxID=1093978 RepID=A0AAV4GY10_9GAST|nr:hypothetical protein ElyMa_004301000 [Elysia marginata]